MGHRKRLLKAIVSLGSTETTASGRTPLPAIVAGRRRAPPTDRDVLRPRRLDRDVGPARSRGYARNHRRLSSLLRRADRAKRGLRRQIHGRRRARLFRLSSGPRTRRRARRAGRAGRRRGGDKTRHRGRLAAARADRDRDRAGRRRGPPRIGGVAGAGRRRRDAEPRGAACSRSRSPGTVVITERTRQSCSGTCSRSSRTLGANELKGIAEVDSAPGRRCGRSAERPSAELPPQPPTAMPLHSVGSEGPESLEQVSKTVPCWLGDDDRGWLRDRLQARREVRRLADDAPLLQLPRSEEVPDDDQPGRDPHPHGQRRSQQQSVV